MYGLKYSIPFTSYELKISQKDYTGSVTTLEAATPAVVQGWDKDEPTAPIKGSSLTANIIGVPLLAFYANNDDEFKGELYKGSTLLFSGYLVQDDCVEDVDDLLHPVSLSFTDNLGLIKDVSLDAALGVTTSKITLLRVIQACLNATGVLLPVDIYASLKEDTHDAANSFFAQTLIAKESFLKSEREYDNCYNVLEQIMIAFNATIVQANGKWNIIRWFEQAPKLFSYSEAFALLTTGAYNNSVTFGKDQSLVPEFGYNKRIVRPYKEVKETFTYRLPGQILKNADLKDLGPQQNSYVISEETYKPDLDVNTTNDFNVTVKEYDFANWFDSNLAPQIAYFFIRVYSDPFGNEYERFVVIKNDNIMSTAIEGNEGDAIKLSFNIRTGAPVGLPANLVFVIQLSDGVRTKYAANDGTWKNTVGYTKTFTTPLNQWNNVTLDIGRLPFDGLVKVFLTTAVPNNTTTETHYNDIRFEYVSYINDSTKITGQTHTNVQGINTKNKSDFDIYVDDSPRNFIAGTLFLNALNGIIQKRTATWNTGKRLGEVTTHEIKEWRSKARTICEGSLHGYSLVSPMTTFTNPAFPNLKFIPGNMQIDYANESVSGTLHEIYETGEALVNTYTFDYIYNVK